jgi:hypothetical protein
MRPYFLRQRRPVSVAVRRRRRRHAVTLGELGWEIAERRVERIRAPALAAGGLAAWYVGWQLWRWWSL